MDDTVEQSSFFREPHPFSQLSKAQNKILDHNLRYCLANLTVVILWASKIAWITYPQDNLWNHAGCLQMPFLPHSSLKNNISESTETWTVASQDIIPWNCFFKCSVLQIQCIWIWCDIGIVSSCIPGKLAKLLTERFPLIGCLHGTDFRIIPVGENILKMFPGVSGMCARKTKMNIQIINNEIMNYFKITAMKRLVNENLFLQTFKKNL